MKGWGLVPYFEANLNTLQHLFHRQYTSTGLKGWGPYQATHTTTRCIKTQLNVFTMYNGICSFLSEQVSKKVWYLMARFFFLRVPNIKICSWNVAGLRAWVKKSGHKYLKDENPDIICLQETKCMENELPKEVRRRLFFLGQENLF